MPVPARYTRLLIDEFDFSSDHSGLTFTVANAPIDVPAFQTEGLQRLPGPVSATLQHNGYYTGPDVGDLEAELHDRLGSETAVYVATLFDTRAVGNPAYVLPSTWGQQLTLDAPIDKLLTVAGNWAEGPVQRGYVLVDGELTATGAGTAVTLPGAGAAGGKGYLFVRAIDGAAVDAEITVECDTADDFPSATTVGTFTFAAVGVVAIDLDDVVETYVRINVTDLGGADGFTVACIVCVDGVTQ
jgi:hypothetical protein